MGSPARHELYDRLRTHRVLAFHSTSSVSMMMTTSSMRSSISTMKMKKNGRDRERRSAASAGQGSCRVHLVAEDRCRGAALVRQ